MSEIKSFDAAPGRPGENAIRIFVEEYDSFSDDYSMVEHCITVDRAREIIAGIQDAIKAAELVPGYIVELEPGCWLADREGDPGRTVVMDNAQVFGSIKAAKTALQEARKFRPFSRAEIVKL